MKTLSEIVGANVRDLRIGAGLRQRDLAERSGVALSSISEVERAAVHPNTLALERLAHGLGVTVSELVTERGESDAIELVPLQVRWGHASAKAFEVHDGGMTPVINPPCVVLVTTEVPSSPTHIALLRKDNKLILREIRRLTNEMLVSTAVGKATRHSLEEFESAYKWLGRVVWDCCLKDRRYFE